MSFKIGDYVTSVYDKGDIFTGVIINIYIPSTIPFIIITNVFGDLCGDYSCDFKLDISKQREEKINILLNDLVN